MGEEEIKYFCIDRGDYLVSDLDGNPKLFKTWALAKFYLLKLSFLKGKVVPVELKICTPSRRATSAAKKKELKMTSAKKVVKKPAGESPWPAKKAQLKPKAKGKK